MPTPGTIHSFHGGMVQSVDPTKIADDQYFFLSNGRVRQDKVRAINQPILFDGLVSGNKQAVVGIGSRIYAIVAGKLYTRDYADLLNTDFLQVAGFSLDATVDRIYHVLIPASNTNYARVSADGLPDGVVTFTVQVPGNSPGFLFQDGINQAWFVNIATNKAFQTRGYNRWNTTNREYVPIGTLMTYVSGRLYIAAKDQEKTTLILRSVTGRPLDFMIQINSSGNKIDALESIGGAAPVAYRVSASELTALHPLDLQNQAFLACTAAESFFVIPDFNNRLFAEPTFFDIRFLAVGAINQESITNLLGNTALIAQAGVRDFNSVAYLENAGRNSVLNRKVFNLTEGITQVNPAAITFDDYALFAMDTRIGKGVLVYDTQLEQFVAFDTFDALGGVVQFTLIEVAGVRRLFVITDGDELYEYSPRLGTPALVRFYPRDVTGDHNKALTLASVDLIFDSTKTGGVAAAECYADRMVTDSAEGRYAATQIDDEDVQQLPFTAGVNKPIIQKLHLRFNESPAQGSRVGVLVAWDGGGSLMSMTLNLVPGGIVNQNQAFSETPPSLPARYKFALIGDDGVANDAKFAIVGAILRNNYSAILGAGDHNNYNDFNAITASAWKPSKDVDRTFFALGNSELDDGIPGTRHTEHYKFFLGSNGNRYWKQSLNENADVFFVNSGFNSAGTLIEPDGNTAGSKQGLAVKALLAESTAWFKLVVMHHSPYVSQASIQQMVLQWPFVSWGATMLACGDPNFYEYLLVDRLPVVNCGTGTGRALGTPDEIVRSDSIFLDSTHNGFLEFTVTSFKATVQFKNSNDTVIHSFQVRRR